jgi:hypothetical protein
MDSQTPEPNLELELSLSQLPDPPFRLSQSSFGHPQDEAGPSQRRKRPRMEQRWHGNLQEEARALVILLQVGSVEPGGHDVTFHGHFQGLNSDQYRGTNPPKEGDSGHHRYLDGPVYPLAKDQRAAFVASTLQYILEFLEM